MATLVWNPEAVGQGNISQQATRKRRAHKKSRKGCRNCKLRSVKCDEATPECRRCLSFGVTCNFDTVVPDLQLRINGAATLKKAPQSPSRALPPPALTITPTPIYPLISDEKSTFQLDGQCLDRLGRFQSRTVLSVGTKRGAVLYQKLAVDFTCFNPCLMHVVQAMTAMHDRYLKGAHTSRSTIAESYHLVRGTSLFNSKLSSTLLPSELDAIWCTSALLGIIAISSMDASNPSEAWPLKPPEPTDLNWLDVSKNKKAVWELTNPLRPDSQFRSVSDEFNRARSLFGENFEGTSGIPMAFIELCDFDDQTCGENNPYYTAVRAISPLIGLPYDQATVIEFLYFLSSMRPEFQSLLHQKDARALLIMAYWYAMGCESVWWLEKRAVMECKAICMYLERFHAGEEMLQALLQFPKMHCGLLSVAVPA